MSGLFKTYRVLALIVGVLLVVGSIASVLKWAYRLQDHILLEGSTLQRLGADLVPVWSFHGFIYIIYVIVAFVLTQKAGWTFPRFLLMMIAGLIPGLIFWVEHRVAVQLRAEHPELAAKKA
ncbi:DUF3817 domain-containing protein [Nocardioides sp. MH1]|uniref:DUF3817 domain-containing protein n=1 Tax=Nocardioides sp. MH1 TaxID=3242490 RepID=UPI003520681D